MKVGTSHCPKTDSNPTTSELDSYKTPTSRRDDNIPLVKQGVDDVSGGTCGSKLPLFEIQGPAFDDE